ncbi:MAG: fibronectin type III domain-containing protein [Acidobacteria bacterium]|nr:fibronectin type III domain-containing protein [Acidobacteriota bacterium]MBV9476711.1 fibronectin type III domain-containing protein [Acidobacteriota bacterium]
MPHLRTAVAALFTLVLATTLTAQPTHLGAPFPLTNTRYGAYDARPQLVANGRDVFLLWNTLDGLRFTRLAHGEKRVGRLVFPATNQAAIVWTGTQFLLAATATNDPYTIYGRLLDGTTGEPLGPAFVLTQGSAPALASNGQNLLLTYLYGFEWRSQLLTLSGQATNDPYGTATHGPQQLTANGSRFAGVGIHDGVVRVLQYTANGLLESQTGVLSGFEPTGVAIASGPSDALAVWTNKLGEVSAARVRRDGVVEPRFSLAEPTTAYTVPFNSPSVVWNGSSYTVAYVAVGAESYEVRIVRVDATAGRVVANEPTAAVNFDTMTSLAAVNGAVTIAWRTYESVNPIVVRNASAAGNGTPAAIAATDQQNSVAASSADTTFVAWNESPDDENKLHIGLRQRDGSWTEGVVANGETPLIAASDVSGFALVVRNASFEYVVRVFDSRGRLTGTTGPLPFEPMDLAANGRGYVVVGWADDDAPDGVGFDLTLNLLGAEITPSGTLLPPVLLQHTVDDIVPFDATIAFNGTELLAVWSKTYEHCGLICNVGTSRLEAVRLTPALQPIDGTAILLDDEIDLAGGVAWDGESFVAVWQRGTEELMQRIGADGTKVGAPVSVLQDQPRYTNAAIVRAVSGGVGITHHGKAVLLAHDGTVTLRTTYAADTPAQWTALPDGNAALITIAPRPDAPHHGSRRIVMQIADSIPLPELPVVPRVSATPHDGLITVDWTAPSQPVNGYRIEYRINDGTWNEVEGWYDANTHAATIRFGFTGVVVGLRVRAFNDAGVGPASTPAIVLPTRRRAVR